MCCSFATLENTGLLFYNGRFNEKHDFIALEIQEGQVVLKYSTGTAPAPVCVINRPERLSTADMEKPAPDELVLLSLYPLSVLYPPFPVCMNQTYRYRHNYL